MLTLYLAALLASAGTLAVQLIHGHGGDGELGDSGDHDSDADQAGPWSLLASVRFWSFALLAFGMVGSLSTWLDLATRGVTLTAAIIMGVLSGLLAVTVVQRLTHRSPTSHATSGDLVGKLARVVVPVGASTRGKVRVEVKGAYVDCIARASEPLDEGETVIIESSEGAEVLVLRAPKELSDT